MEIAKASSPSKCKQQGGCDSRKRAITRKLHCVRTVDHDFVMASVSRRGQFLVRHPTRVTAATRQRHLTPTETLTPQNFAQNLELRAASCGKAVRLMGDGFE